LPPDAKIDLIQDWLYTSKLGAEKGGKILENIRLETNARRVDGFQVVDAVGEIDVYTAPQFKQAVNAIIDSGQKDLIVNMAQVSYMDSSGFGTLLSATKRLRPLGGTVNLVACNSAIDRMLKITRLNTVFGTFGTIDEALGQVGIKK
jgi:anti-sigma B factor antagonist